MMTFLRTKWIFVVVITLSLLTLVRTQMYYGRIYHGSDAQFYYALAHSLTFDLDSDITNNLLLTPYTTPFDPSGDGSWSAAPRKVDGGIPSKYPIGLSLIEVPLLWVGYFVRLTVETIGISVSGAIGYSWIELWCVAIGLLVIFAAGVQTLYGLLIQEYDRLAAILGIIGCWVGTSLFYYSAVFPFMTHAVSFVALTLLLKVIRDISNTKTVNSSFALLGAGLAGVFLIRPQQFLISLFLLPVFVKVVRTRPMTDWAVGSIVGGIAILTAIATQMWFNYSQFGVVTISGYSTGGEGFNWFAPHLSMVLFDASRGLLVFSPVIVIAAIGYILYARYVPGYVWIAVGNAIAQIYVVSAWSSPEQGDSFGARMWSDNTAIVAVGLSLLFHRTPVIGRWLTTGGILLAVGWTMYLLARFLGIGN
ncbi:hypothetical protein GobsU_01517 [Candidatus Moduliflexus flocculans]|uniref:Glycosyltransferase RgtA/B/C/D-like domain-containing protein n=1 Tax=Candidatus Moduliflexus flocculans TaxID=1499966 RepID=A0A0S6W448_9BACT|nr:hypothetical protein GobsU_01517 [Candidatus Moduliflexus flocculans]